MDKKVAGGSLATVIGIASLILGWLQWQHPHKDDPGHSPSSTSLQRVDARESFKGTIAMPSGGCAYAHKIPSLRAEATRCIPDGTSVRITCTVQGETVSGNGIASSLWDKVEDGYVPDVVVYTGTNEPTMPRC